MEKNPIIEKLINEKALISSLSSKDFTMLKRLEKIDEEIKSEIQTITRSNT